MASTYQQRVEQWGLRPNRAKVIIPACHILLACLQDSLSWERIQLPQGGLVDGVLSYLAEILSHKKHRLQVSSITS